jgi:hypothetical protein
MGFLRRILGARRDEGADEPTAPPNEVDLAADERQHELDVLREEAARLDDLA